MLSLCGIYGKPDLRSWNRFKSNMLTAHSGWANNRLVEGTTAALQHNLGLGGAVVVTVYKRADGKESKPVTSEEIGKHNQLGYNPAVEAKGFTKSQVDRVRSKKMRSEWVSQEQNILSVKAYADDLDRHCRMSSRRSSRDSRCYHVVDVDTNDMISDVTIQAAILRPLRRN